MKQWNNEKYHHLFWGVLMLLLCLFFYVLHWVVFRDIHHIFLYLITDIGFLFFQVVVVTLIIDRLLRQRQRQSILSKLNMVIGAFFSEVGTPLLKMLPAFDTTQDGLAEHLRVHAQWKAKDYIAARQFVMGRQLMIDAGKGDLPGLRQMVIEKRDFLLRLLENPNLLEHDQFTELLLAVFHLTEELCHRDSLADLPTSDLTHLAGDFKRAYGLLLREWLSHIEYLQRDYPYLFSLAVRLNPYDASATPVVK